MAWAFETEKIWQVASGIDICSVSSIPSGEGDIRQKLIEADLEDCMVALPGQFFYSTQIPVCFWLIGEIERTGNCRALAKVELALAA